MCAVCCFFIFRNQAPTTAGHGKLVGAGQLPPAQRTPPTADPLCGGALRGHQASHELLVHGDPPTNSTPCQSHRTQIPVRRRHLRLTPIRKAIRPAATRHRCTETCPAPRCARLHFYRAHTCGAPQHPEKDRSNTPRPPGQSTRPTVSARELTHSGTPAQMPRAPRPAARQTTERGQHEDEGADQSNTSNGKPRPHKGESSSSNHPPAPAGGHDTGRPP